jgi:hypothetical protein
MLKFIFTSAYLLVIAGSTSFAQDIYIHSKEGRSVLNKAQMISNCMRSLHKVRTDKVAVAICECEVSKLEGRFTNSQFKSHTHKDIVDIESLLKEDTLVKKEIADCYTSTGKAVLFQAEGFENEFISECVKSIKKSTAKKLDSIRLVNFCSCQLDLIKSKRISDAELRTLENPNSLLFYELLYKCGDIFSTTSDIDNKWNQQSGNDITGPLADTFKILTFHGMTYVKIKVGSTVQFWLLDTGASDLLINKEMETTLKNENIITDANYLGIAEYEMANGEIDTCRRYKINAVQIGKFKVNNVVIAVTDKGKRIVAGKALLNKFSNWILNNKEDTLILSR